MHHKARPLVDKPTNCQGCHKNRPPSYFTRSSVKCDDCLPKVYAKPKVASRPGHAARIEAQYYSRRDEKFQRRIAAAQREQENGDMDANTLPPVRPPDEYLAPHCGLYVKRSDDPVVPLESQCTYPRPDIHEPEAWLLWTAFNKRNSRDTHLQHWCRACEALAKVHRAEEQKAEIDRIVSKEAADTPIQAARDVPDNGEPDPFESYVIPSTAPFSELPYSPVEMAEALVRYVRQEQERVSIGVETMAEVELLREKVARQEADLKEANELVAAYGRDVQDADARVELQKEYQRRLIRAGTIIPSKFLLFTPEEVVSIREGEE